MKYFLIVLGIAFMLGNSACQSKVGDANTQSIDSAMAVLHSAVEIIEGINTADIEPLRVKYQAFHDFFTNEYDDISNRDFYTHELMDMAECTKFFSLSTKELAHWQHEGEEISERLEKLKHDYVNQLISEIEYKTWLADEYREAAHYYKEFQENVGGISVCMRNSEALVAKLDSAKTAFLAAQ